MAVSIIDCHDSRKYWSSESAILRTLEATDKSVLGDLSSFDTTLADLKILSQNTSKKMNSTVLIFICRLFALSRSFLFDVKMKRVKNLIIWRYLSRTPRTPSMQELQLIVHNFFRNSDFFPALSLRSLHRFVEEPNKLKISRRVAKTFLLITSDFGALFTTMFKLLQPQCTKETRKLIMLPPKNGIP